MASLKDIRRRIVSVKNTQKITRAMKLVSAAKFARANHAVTAARPYGKALDSMVSRLVLASADLELPLTRVSPEKRALVVLVGTDRGFCGSLNSSLFRSTMHFIRKKRDAGVEIELVTWGKRAKLFADKLRYKVVASEEKVVEKGNYENARERSQWLIDKFLTGGYDRVYISYMAFQSALSQAPVTSQLLPVMPPENAAGEEPVANLLLEPSKGALVESLLTRKVASNVHRALLEAAASEHGARMTAMDSATSNAGEVIKKLSIEYNRARQAAITKELIEITSGAEAL